MITKEQRSEWVENPVTIELAKFVFEELQRIREIPVTDVFHPYEPYKTQEILAGLNGAEDTWDIVHAYLTGERTVEEDDE